MVSYCKRYVVHLITSLVRPSLPSRALPPCDLPQFSTPAAASPSTPLFCVVLSLRTREALLVRALYIGDQGAAVAETCLRQADKAGAHGDEARP